MAKYKINKNVIGVCIILLLFKINCDKTSTESTEKTVEDKQAEEHTKKLFEDEGISDGSEFTKEKFKNFMRNLLNIQAQQEGGDKTKLDPQRQDFIERLVEKVSKNVPEKFGVEEMSSYLEEKIMVRLIEEVNNDIAAERSNKLNQEQESNTEL